MPERHTTAMKFGQQKAAGMTTRVTTIMNKRMTTRMTKRMTARMTTRMTMRMTTRITTRMTTRIPQKVHITTKTRRGSPVDNT